MVAFFVLSFTLAGTPRKSNLAGQARAMLGAELSGVPARAQLRMKVRRGDRVIAYVGAPEKLFVGDAVVAAGYHRWTDEKAARFSDWLGYDHGFTLRDVHVWSRPVPLMSVWPQTNAAGTNPRALFLGGIVALSPSDGRTILLAGANPGHEDPEGDIGRAPLVSATPPPSSAVSRQRHQVSAPNLGAPSAAAARTLVVAASSRPSDEGVGVPDVIAHADWGTAIAKRIVATAELEADGGYVAHQARIVAQADSLLERMRVASVPGTALLGFDFPIGVPRAYADRAGIKNFATWLRELDPNAAVFQVATHVSEVSIGRPFFPRNVTEKSPGLKGQFRAALGLSADESLRRCDAAHEQRVAASEMFWTLGPKAVGKATLAGWRDAIKPALSQQERRCAIWPFDGPLFELIDRVDVVIVETYPAEFYRRLGLQIGTPGHSKTNPDARRAAAPQLLAWCTEHGVVPDDGLVGQIMDGFGPSKDGEDPFDAVVGLLGMIATVSAQTEPELPDDTAVREVEGWMFGQRAGPSTAAIDTEYSRRPLGGPS
jgi:hypothetical protein